MSVAIVVAAGVVGSVLLRVAPPAARRPNSIRCDRVVLAVWLKRPAERVAARLAGRRFSLEDAAAGRAAGGRWMGEGPVSARVRLWVTARGRTAVTTVRPRRRAGWG